ncbi:MAG: ribokinase [Deferribacterota bacterium]|nr:ribokinase [Deferribacterota bacterium]
MCYNQNNIVVVGSSNIDLVIRAERLPKLGETLIGESFKIGFGGKGANQAVMASKLKAGVSMVTKLGSDIFGKETLNNFKNFNINTNYVYFADESTGVAPIFVDDKGNNFIVIVPGANWLLKPNDVKIARDLIATSNILICQLEVPLETTLEALKIAKSAGILTLFNPAPARQLPSEIYRYVDIIAPNEVEAELLTGVDINSVEDAKKAAFKLFEKGVKNVLITLGDKGALSLENGNLNIIPAINVKPVDTTGAGDAFIGAFAYRYVITKSLEDSVKFANVAAGLSVRKMGTQVSFPTLDEVTSYYRKLFGDL